MSRTEIERAFSSSLLRLARGYRREIDVAMARHELSEARALPVLYIARLGDGVRHGVLAEALGIEGPSLVRLLDALCLAGLVTRKDDPSDGRAKTLHLTENGRALATKIEAEGDLLRSRLFQSVSDADLGAAVRVFALIEEAISGQSQSADHENI